MTHHSVRHRKRSAIEPVDALLSDQEAVPMVQRPASTSLGALFVLARGVAGLLWLAAFLLLWRQIEAEAELDAETGPIVLWLVLGLGLVGVLVLFVLAWAIWRGSNLARLLVMIGLTGSTLTAAAGYFLNGEEITINTTLLTVALDILVLLALSSRDSRAWSRRRRA